MRETELTVDEHGIRFHHCNPAPMSAEQKFYIALALIIATAFLGLAGIVT